MGSGRRRFCAVAIVTAAVTAAGHAAIRAQTGSSHLQVLQGHGPLVLAELPGEFSFFMWFRRTAAGPDPMYTLESPGAFDLLVDPQDQSIRLHRGIQQAPPLELVLPLRDGNGQVPQGEWILVGASWNGATGDFRAWARSESVARVDDATVAPALPPALPEGDLTLGSPQRAGTAAQQGDYGLIVFRDHAIDGTDFDEVWDSRDYFGGYRLDNTGDGGNLTGDLGAAWMVNHAILTNPGESVTGIPASAAIPGDDVDADNFCVFTIGDPSSTLLTTGLVTGLSDGADAFRYFSPHDENGFFVRHIPDVALPDPPYVAGVAPKIRQLATAAPDQLIRCVVSANSRGVKTSDADNRTWPEHYAHGFIANRLDQVAGVLNRPARLNAGLRWFGFDTTGPPVNLGLIASLTSTGAQQDFARFWTNSGHATAGPGQGLWLAPNALYTLKARPEPGSLVTAEAPLVVRTYMLRFPGAGTLSWRPVKSSAQQVTGWFGAAASVDLGSPASFTHVMTAADGVDPAGGRLFLDGDHTAQVAVGNAAYISSGMGQRGIAVVIGVASDGLTTEITFEHWFKLSPTTDSTIVFGAWEVVAIEYEWPALSESDLQTWRGLELTALGGPLVNFAWDAWRPDVNGFVIGGAGWGGNGYSPQLLEANEAATPAWMAALEPDIWLQGFAQQNSSPPIMHDYLGQVRLAAPDVEAAWIGEGAHLGSIGAPWHEFIVAEAAVAGVVAASAVTDDTVGSFLDQAVDGLRNNGAHMSHRGNVRLAETWLELLGQAARYSPDLDGDGVVGIADLLILLGAWGPCPAPPEACLADIDGDGVVGISDFLFLLGVWGSDV